MTEKDKLLSASVDASPASFDLIDLAPEERSLLEKRMAEAIIFAAEAPLSLNDLQDYLPAGCDIDAVITSLQKDYDGRGIELVHFGKKVFFRTSGDLSFLLRREVDDIRKLSRAGVETLSIIAYHQPVTRAEIEDIRGVTISKGTLDVLMEAGWVRPLGRRQSPGRPVIYGTTSDFLIHFGIESLKDLPGLAELKAAGLLDTVEEALHSMQVSGQASGQVSGKTSGESRQKSLQIDIEEAILAEERQSGFALINPSDFEEDISDDQR